MSDKSRKEYCDIMNMTLSERERIIYDGAYTFALVDQQEKLIRLERQLAEEKAKTKALLVGLEVQNIDDFINRANLENYKKLGESITIGFKEQLKEKG